MAIIKCLNCLNKMQTNEQEKTNCEFCNQELNVLESELINKLTEQEITLIKKKLKKYEATYNYTLSSKIAALIPENYRLAESFLVLAATKAQADSLYNCGHFFMGKSELSWDYESNRSQNSLKAKEYFELALKNNHPLAQRRLLAFNNDNASIVVQSLSGWQGPKSINIDLEDILKVDSSLEVLRNYSNIKIIASNMYHHSYSPRKSKDVYKMECVVLNTAVDTINNAMFKNIDTLVFLGDKGFPTYEAFKDTIVNKVIFINSGFLNGKNFLVEGCDYIMNNFDNFNDKENFIKTLQKNTDKILQLTKQIIIKDKTSIATSFLINNSIVKYEILLQCLNEDISEEKKVLLLNATNNTSKETIETHVKKIERKEELDLGLDNYTLKDFKNEYSCSKKEGKIIISKYNGKETTIIIPSNVDNITNFEIDGFGKNDTVKTIIFEEGITSLTLAKETKFGVFHYLKNLKEIILPSSLSNLDHFLFNNLNADVLISTKGNELLKVNKDIISFKDNLVNINNKKTLSSLSVPQYIANILDLNLNNCSLKELIIPNTVKSIRSINLKECFSLEYVSLPDNITYLDDEAFLDCSSLKEVVLPTDVITIGARCFKGCTKLEKADLPNKVEVIKEQSFYICNSLKEVKFHDSIKELEYASFGWCTSLTELILPKNISRINKSVFKECKKITNLTIPSNIKIIGEKAFFECIRLVNIIIEDGVQTIKESAFEECRKLKTLHIPSSVITIEGSICKYCKNLVITTNNDVDTSNWHEKWDEIDYGVNSWDKRNL